MASDGDLTHKIIFLVFAGIDLLLGLACFACGIWFHASKDMYSYITVFVASKSDQTLRAAAGILLAVGIILSLLCILGVVGIILKSMRKLATVFIALLPIIFILGLVSGFLVVGFRYQIHMNVKQGMLDQLQNQYTWDGRIGQAWNRVQVKKRCCGVDGSWDYEESQWYADTNPDEVNVQSYVPTTCCVLNFNQDRELYWVDPQKPQPKDEKRCNEDAAGKIDNSANLNGQGCFAALFSRNKDLWHDQSIFTIMDVITGLGLSAGFYQLVMMPVGFFLLRMMDQDEKVRR